ncbi:MAG: proline/glycine betaine ABC transporter permease [Clostridia bacterium]|nr:proline/glycine betaine ABC transporter permease [Clostridia bacterium]
MIIYGRIPIGDFVEKTISFLDAHIGFATKAFSNWMEVVITVLTNGLTAVPTVIFGIIAILAAFWLAGRNVAIFTGVGVFLVNNMGLWQPAMATIAMVLIATAISIILGVPLGIICARNSTANRVVTPVLDLMQTMPAFVYLIPVIPFFGLGAVPAVMATVIFSMPPTIRLTNLGIRQVPGELIEACDAFGATPGQKLIKVQLPLALKTIMAGVNQTIMLALSMVVIAAMIGAGGLGGVVWRSIQRLDVGLGFEAGLGVVILAMILDRLTHRLAD